MFTVIDDSTYGLNACYDAVKTQVEMFKENPVHLLGIYTLRASQDALFNTNMITALMEYIKDNNIKWNDKIQEAKLC